MVQQQTYEQNNQQQNQQLSDTSISQPQSPKNQKTVQFQEEPIRIDTNMKDQDTTTQETSNYEQSDHYDETSEQQLELVPCPYCGRKFASNRIEKHKAICSKPKTPKKIYNSAEQRSTAFQGEEKQLFKKSEMNTLKDVYKPTVHATKQAWKDVPVDPDFLKKIEEQEKLEREKGREVLEQKLKQNERQVLRTESNLDKYDEIRRQVRSRPEIIQQLKEEKIGEDEIEKIVEKEYQKQNKNTQETQQNQQNQQQQQQQQQQQMHEIEQNQLQQNISQSTQRSQERQQEYKEQKKRHHRHKSNDSKKLQLQMLQQQFQLLQQQNSMVQQPQMLQQSMQNQYYQPQMQYGIKTWNFCPYCGSKYAPGAQFCFICGEKKLQ